MPSTVAGGPLGAPAERRAAVVTDRALAWLRDNGRKRFLLWAHYFDPHAPYDPPKPFKDSYAQDPYSGEVAYMDEQVGRLLDGVKQMGLASRTLVVVLGDHGESLGEHGELTHGVFLYESTLCIPFIVSGPGIPAGKVVGDQVRSIDLLPTLTEFLNLSPVRDVQGVSLWPLLRLGTRVNSGYSYSETLYPRTYMGWSELAAMRTDKWKLVVAPRSELYDLTNDPNETQNLIEKNRAEAEKLRRKIAGLEKGRQDTAGASQPDPAKRRQLESLGYVGGGTARQLRLGSPAPDPKDRVESLKIISRVEELLGKAMYADAARLMEQGLRLDPTNPRAHVALGMAYEAMGDYRRAVGTFLRALGAKIQTDKIYSRLGIDYLHLGETAKAIDALENAIAINPKDSNNLLNLGMAYLQAGRVPDAEKSFRAITTQNDRFAAAHNGLGLVAIQRGETEVARREFEKAVELSPDEPKFLLDLGILYQNSGNSERALSCFRGFAAKAPPGKFTAQLSAVHEAIRELSAQQRAAGK
jgi:tetratricopeptide (TPR) repeat protein